MRCWTLELRGPVSMQPLTAGWTSPSPSRLDKLAIGTLHSGHRGGQARLLVAKQRISGCTLTLRMHPEMRWGAEVTRHPTPWLSTRCGHDHAYPPCKKCPQGRRSSGPRRGQRSSRAVANSRCQGAFTPQRRRKDSLGPVRDLGVLLLPVSGLVSQPSRTTFNQYRMSFGSTRPWVASAPTRTGSASPAGACDV